MKPNAKLIEAFDDLISEKELKEKLNVSVRTLQYMRSTGQIKNWRTLAGRKIMYSKSEIARLFNLTAQ